MRLSDLVSIDCGSKHGECERCHRTAELKRVKVKGFDGMPEYQYLCSQCAVMEKVIKC